MVGLCRFFSVPIALYADGKFVRVRDYRCNAIVTPCRPDPDITEILGTLSDDRT
jgi:hypothetical protein